MLAHTGDYAAALVEHRRALEIRLQVHLAQ
jgi:hypothetical protein